MPESKEGLKTKKHTSCSNNGVLSKGQGANGQNWKNLSNKISKAKSRIVSNTTQKHRENQ